MKKQEMRSLWVFFICALLVCALIFLFMITYMNDENNRSVQSVGEIYMDEMSTQMQHHFKSIIELRLDMVEGIILRTPPESYPEYNQEMIDQLRLNGRTRNFDFLALYSRQGGMEIIIGESVAITDEQKFLDSLNDEESKLARALTNSGRELLMMGVSTVYPMESGQECTALIAGIDLGYIDYAMSLKGDESLCYAHIIRKDGSFVIRTEDTDYIKSDNYFTYLSGCQGDGEPIEQIVSSLQESMAEGREYSAAVLVEEGSERRKLYCVPLDHSEWYLICVMPHGKLDEAIQTAGRRRTVVSMTCALTVLLLLLAIFLLYFQKSRQQMKLLSQARQEADRASRAKSQFLSNMSHDIRTPMNAIVGMTAIAQNNLNNQERVGDCLRKISVSSKYLLGLINDILDMSRIESGKMTLRRDLVSLRETMDDLVSITQPQVREKKQSFDIYISSIQTEMVLCDGMRLSQVLLNILSNALKFTPEGGRITVSVSQEGSPLGPAYVRTHFRIRDTGIGMSEEFQTTIFESFTREDSTRVHHTEGTGLGMAITKRIVDASGGTVELWSRQDEGTEFHVILDLEKAEAGDADMRLPEWNVLVVDDDESLCRGAAEFLNEIGARAEWTLSGASAVEMAEQRRAQGRGYHVILLDWKMPGMDGVETARVLSRRLGEDVSLLLISAYAWDDIEETARDAGIQGFIAKPLFKSTLYYGLSRFAGSGGLSEDAGEESGPDFTGRRLLVAEDNELNWEIARELLSELGFRLDWAENGRICTEMFRSAPPGTYSGILMDLRMPEMDGYEATRAIRSMDGGGKTIPIIAMTADAFSEDAQKCLDCGMNAHTAKPLNMQELTRLLRRYL